MIKIAVILSDIRSTHNVGSILRSCDCFGVDQVFFSGMTPYPKLKKDTRLPHMVERLAKSIHKTALGAENTLDFSVHEDDAAAIKYARQLGYKIACLEQSKSSKPLSTFNNSENIAIILGNEVSGLSIQTLDSSDVILEIPLFGKKESLNVSVASAIALYSLRLKEA
jgi:tRNA G18 (ribose-2'-O)-methylase SpoU